MCLLCKEVAKEIMTPRDFWRNYREISEEHMPEVIAAMSKTSYEYQAKVANAAYEEARESEK